MMQLPPLLAVAVQRLKILLAQLRFALGETPSGTKLPWQTILTYHKVKLASALFKTNVCSHKEETVGSFLGKFSCHKG